MGKARLDTTESQLPVVDAPLARRPDDNGTLAHVGEPTVASILDRAVSMSMTPEGLEKLVALHERMQDREAAREFAGAMAAFQQECPPIRKTSVAKVTSNRTGSSHSYKYAELDEIANTIRPILHKHGLSYTWDSTEEKGQLVCTCTVRHQNGHGQSAKFGCPTDTAAAMSAQQKNAAALTYARRQSLIQALGLTTCDPDSDGAGPLVSDAVITESQAADLELAIENVKGDVARFCRHFGINALSEMRAASLPVAFQMIEEKRKAQR